MSDRREQERQAFLDASGWKGVGMSALPGDASTRRYFRVTRGSEQALLMDQPQTEEAPSASMQASAEERRALGYNALARLAGANVARFAAAAAYLRNRGVTAPAVYAADPERGFLLIEDFGDALYADAIAGGEPENTLYGPAIDALAALHAESAPEHLEKDIPFFSYDATALLAETDLFTEWFVPAALKRPASSGEISEHRALWQEALGKLNGMKPVFVHRDYHAQNLLWLPDREGARRAGMIDFQDAVAGSRAYDIISLLEDARRDVAPELARAMTERYLAASGMDKDIFGREAAFFAAQRNTKIVGIFARLAKRDKKPRYLSYLPRVWGHLERDLDHPDLRGLKAWYDKVAPAPVRGVLALEGVS